MLNQVKKIFFVGIKGVAMANLAIILKKMGKQVSGSDVKEEFITDSQLTENNIKVTAGFSPSDLPDDLDLLVYSSAHRGKNNPQVLQAKKTNVKTVSQAELLADLLSQFKIKLAVCGCHGKTTTSSLLSYALIKLGAKPSYMIGSSNFNEYPGGDFGSYEYFVVEADEYGVNPPYDLTPKFHLLNPDYILCTNIDYDHPDVYPNLETTKAAFLKFFDEKKLILCIDDPNLLQLINRLKQDQFVTFGFNKTANLRITDIHSDIDGSGFNLEFKNNNLGNFRIKLFGEKNISNAAGVILLLLQLGFPVEKIKNAIKDFKGARRRFELIYENRGIYLLDDYAHHPEEIKATVMAAKSRFPRQRLVVIFQPHTYSRTQKLLKEFTLSLSLADKVFVMPIFASARENQKDFNISSEDIANSNPEKIKFVKSKDVLLHLLSSTILPQDIVFTLGAGDIYKLKDDIIKIIATQ